MSSLPLEMGFTWAVITLDKTVATGEFCIVRFQKVMLLQCSRTWLTSIFTFSVMVTILLQMVILDKCGKWSKVSGG